MNDNKRILIFTADAGRGHRSAAEAIEAALKRSHGNECTTEIVNPLRDERVPAIVHRIQNDYDQVVRDRPELYELGYEATDAAVPITVIESVLTLMLFTVTRDLLREYKPDAVVATYPYYHAILSAIFTVDGEHMPLFTVVTDLVTVHRMWFNQAVDMCLVPTQAAYDLALSHGLSPEQVKVSGIPVNPNIADEKRDGAAIRAELGWDPELTTLLVVGSKRVGNLTDVLRVLNHSGLPIQVVAVAGGDEELYDQLQDTEWHTAAHVYNFVETMPEFMQAADCIVCKAGGLIVTEALASGLPLLLVDVLPGQEVGNADYVVEGGAGELAQDSVLALETIYHWLDDDGAMLAERAENARRLGHPGAAYEIAEEIWQTLQREQST